jgi:hypothetical protein
MSFLNQLLEQAIGTATGNCNWNFNVGEKIFVKKYSSAENICGFFFSVFLIQKSAVSYEA